MLLVVDAGHPLIVVIETSIIRTKFSAVSSVALLFFSLSLFLSRQQHGEVGVLHRERREKSQEASFFILMFRVYRLLSKP